MNNTITVTVRTKTWPNPHDLYTIDVNGRELDVDQKCVDRLHDLAGGEWEAEFDGGIVLVYASFKRSQPPKLCAECGRQIPRCRYWCDDCVGKKIRGEA